jgi:hypothetical protein
MLFVTFGAILAGGPRAATAVLVALLLSGTVVVWRARRLLSASGPTEPVTWRGRFDTARRWMMSVLAVCVVMALSALAGNLMGIKPPRQADVVVQFQKNKSSFEELRDMTLTDGLSVVMDGGKRYARERLEWAKEPGEIGITPQRASDYRRLLGAAGCSRIDVWQDGSVNFSVAAWGAANRGWRLNLSWSKDEPSRIVPTVDDLASTNGDWVFSHIEGDWYVGLVR